MDMFDFDDIIQYHARNLYELFYKRKGQQRSYSLKKRSQKKIKEKKIVEKKIRVKLTPEEIKERKREYNRQYRQKNKEKFREYDRKKYEKRKLKKQECK